MISPFFLKIPHLYMDKRGRNIFFLYKKGGLSWLLITSKLILLFHHFSKIHFFFSLSQRFFPLAFRGGLAWLAVTTTPLGLFSSLGRLPRTTLLFKLARILSVNLFKFVGVLESVWSEDWSKFVEIVELLMALASVRAVNRERTKINWGKRWGYLKKRAKLLIWRIFQEY